MKLLKQFTFLRFYIAVCAVAVTGFAYAEYYGYDMLGSDENTTRTTSGSHGHVGSSIHHK